MPYVHRTGDGLVRGWSVTKTPKFTEWLDDGHVDLVEYEEYIESEINPTKDDRAAKILESPVIKITLGAMLDQENRIRVLEGQPPYAESDYIQAAIDKYLVLDNQE